MEKKSWKFINIFWHTVKCFYFNKQLNTYTYIHSHTDELFRWFWSNSYQGRSIHNLPLLGKYGKTSQTFLHTILKLMSLIKNTWIKMESIIMPRRHSKTKTKFGILWSCHNLHHLFQRKYKDQCKNTAKIELNWSNELKPDSQLKLALIGTFFGLCVHMLRRCLTSIKNYFEKSLKVQWYVWKYFVPNLD